MAIIYTDQHVLFPVLILPLLLLLVVVSPLPVGVGCGVDDGSGGHSLTYLLGGLAAARDYRYESGAKELRMAWLEYSKAVEWESQGLLDSVASHDERITASALFTERIQKRVEVAKQRLTLNGAFVAHIMDALSTLPEKKLEASLMMPAEGDEDGDSDSSGDSHKGSSFRTHVLAAPVHRGVVVEKEDDNGGEYGDGGASGGASLLCRLAQCQAFSSAESKREPVSSLETGRQTAREEQGVRAHQYDNMMDLLAHLAREYGDGDSSDGAPAATTNDADSSDDDCDVHNRSPAGNAGPPTGTTGLRTFYRNHLVPLVITYLKEKRHAHRWRVLIPGAGLGGLVAELFSATRQLKMHRDGPVEIEILATECSPTLFPVLACLFEPLCSAQITSSAETNAIDLGPPSRVVVYPWVSAFDNLRHGDESDQFAAVALTLPLPLPGPVCPVRSGSSVVDNENEAPREASTELFLLQADLFVKTDDQQLKRKPSPEAPVPSLTGLFDAVLLSYVLDAFTPRQAGMEWKGTSTKTIPKTPGGGGSMGSVVDLLSMVDSYVAPEGLLVHYGPLQYHHPRLRGKLTVDDIVSYFVDALGYELLERSSSSSARSSEFTRASDPSIGCEGSDCSTSTGAPSATTTVGATPLSYSRPFGTSLYGNGHFPELLVLRKK